MGIRDWPQQVRRGPFEDVCDKGALRYVLEGCGTVTARGQSISVTQNSLITVQEQCTLSWQPEEEEFVLLTPEYNGPPIGLVFGAFAAMCVCLVSLTAASAVESTIEPSSWNQPMDVAEGWMALCQPPAGTTLEPVDDSSSVQAAHDAALMVPSDGEGILGVDLRMVWAAAVGTLLVSRLSSSQSPGSSP